MVPLLTAAGPFAAACLCGALFAEATSVTLANPDTHTFHDATADERLGAEVEEAVPRLASASAALQDTAETLAVDGAHEDSTQTAEAPPAFDQQVQGKGWKRFLAAAFVLLAVAIVTVRIAIVAKRKRPVEELSKKYDIVVKQLEEARDDARRLGAGLPALFDEMIDVYEEHYETVRRRFMQAVDISLISGLIDPYTVGRLKVTFLKSCTSLHPKTLQELWADMREYIDTEVPQDKIATFESLAQGLIARTNENLSISRQEYGQLLRSTRDDIVKILAKHERHPGSVITAQGETMGDVAFSLGQEYVHTVRTIFNRDSTLRPCKKALSTFENGLREYTKTLQRVAELSVQADELEAALEDAEKGIAKAKE